MCPLKYEVSKYASFCPLDPKIYNQTAKLTFDP